MARNNYKAGCYQFKWRWKHSVNLFMLRRRRADPESVPWSRTRAGNQSTWGHVENMQTPHGTEREPCRASFKRCPTNPVLQLRSHIVPEGSKARYGGKHQQQTKINWKTGSCRRCCVKLIMANTAYRPNTRSQTRFSLSRSQNSTFGHH